MAKKAENVIALPFFPGGYGKKGRKCHSPAIFSRGVWQKRPKMSYHEAEKTGGNGAGRGGMAKRAENVVP